MSASNIYQALEALQAPDASTSHEEVFPNSSWNNEEEQKEVYSILFDLAQLQKKLGTSAVFTIDLLQEIRDNKIAVQQNMQKARHFRRLSSVIHHSPFGKFRVWDDVEDDDETENVLKCISVRLMSRIELHPKFQRNFWRYSKTNRILRVNNQLQGKDCWVPIPYTLVLDTLAHDEKHRSNKIMQEYWRALQNTKRLWMKSSSRAKVLQMADKLATRFKSINSIVCFGLGALNHDKAFYESSLQHMTAFTIAKHLENAYQKENGQKRQVEVICQDPCYTKKDHELLGKLYQGGKLSFTSDPDGLLAIGSNTIVMTAFLPIGYPLMQVIADMFQDKQGEGPAAIICDSMTLNPDQELYSLCDRASPGVAQFLTQEYTVSDFKDHVLEVELAKDMFGEGPDRPYWLSSMQLYTRSEM